MSSLLESLGIDPDEAEWQDLALCSNVTTELFFDKYETDSEVARATDALCLKCPVLRDCFFAGSKNGNYGIWGGIYWNGSGKPDKNKNAHKTQETWDKIYKKVAE